VIQNINDTRTSLVLGRREQVLFGPGYIVDELCGCRFRISAKSFYQVNPRQTEVLYRQAMEFAGLSGREQVLDAYCGTGTIGIIAAKQGAGSVLGVELNPDAVRDAVTNARENGVKQIRFACGDAGELMTDMAAAREPCDLVFLDPPRAGASRAFLQALCQLAPRRVVYISCEPETLARDLRFLRGQYRVEAIQPVDMFPHTKHVETVCLLSKLHANQHIEVELQMDELDLTAAESKATYEEIKEYVLKQSGLKVSNLYIAQVKQKCGIIERENYNLPKSENSRQPKCPPEKEVAIREALEYFRMI
jgi:23S rRNA (uracil1939-C5)-methyltransferase